jgi:hypothetical protein
MFNERVIIAHNLHNDIRGRNTLGALDDTEQILRSHASRARCDSITLRHLFFQPSVRIIAILVE